MKWAPDRTLRSPPVRGSALDDRAAVGFFHRPRWVAAVSLLALFTFTSAGTALDEVRYAVPDKPWPGGLGNHRAVLRVEQKADAVVERIPWRRRDRDPERKDIIVTDAATGLRVTNVARLSNDRFEGALAFQPQTVPGDYFVYYLPYPPQKGWGSYRLDYLKPNDTADPAWKARSAAVLSRSNVPK